MTFDPTKLTYVPQYKGYVFEWVPELPAGVDGIKAFQHEGKNFLFYPHTIKNAVATGISPVPPDHVFPGQFQPYSHQKATVEFILRHKESFVLNGMGSGKTISSLWASDIIQTETNLPTLIIAPLSTLHHTWGKTIFLNFPNKTYNILHGSKSKRQKLLEAPADFYIINADGVKLLEADLCRVRKFSHIILDESTCVKNGRSERHRAFKTVFDAHRQSAYLTAMSGTPTANSPTDCYYQVKLLRPVYVKNCYPYYQNFVDATMLKVAQYVSVPKARSDDVVKSFIQPSIRFSLEDCREMPERVYITKEVSMSKEQQKAYAEMAKQMLLEIQNHTISAVNAGVCAMRLIQIACGVAYSEAREPVFFPYDSRLKATIETIDESEKNVLIFSGFTALSDRLVEDLKKEGYNVEKVDGGTPTSTRNDIYNWFEKDERKKKIIVASPGCMSHGLSLLSASTILWVSPVTSAETMLQAEGRNFRISTDHRCVVVRLCGSPIEEKCFNRIGSKVSMMEALLDAVNEDSKKYLA